MKTLGVQCENKAEEVKVTKGNHNSLVSFRREAANLWARGGLICGGSGNVVRSVPSPLVMPPRRRPCSSGRRIAIPHPVHKPELRPNQGQALFDPLTTTHYNPNRINRFIRH
jgi:hypothetical protein